jgi:hypothetical protein
VKIALGHCFFSLYLLVLNQQGHQLMNARARKEKINLAFVLVVIIETFLK